MSIFTELTEIAKTMSTTTLSTLVIAIVYSLFKSIDVIKLLKKALESYINGMGKTNSITVTIVKRVFKANSILLDASMLLNSSAFTVVEVLAKRIADSGEDAKDN
ncbi:hypothetical protein ACJ5M4_004670, partial [Vibrio antiquarius]